ncbi:geranylgeranyl reductase family protein [Phormidium yuhuli AB48]|uniref:Geranylgeranyl reductase family protein n=1 Tax=Phormidium yuhuli AB48 TaxID=2940671 RepID=A0ABY5AK89_9CYAN|nr:geranylgeranyl reductase family protein [Phormidium yuhuli]USR89272.1 geranylgeranyl reductase family protein [Phormidium yuhuli AB48]
MSLNYDLIVCGGGPSGATAALKAAQAGLRVALIEKQRLPRHKPCGGGMPLRVGQWLPGGIPEGVVETSVRHLYHTWKFQEGYLGAVSRHSSSGEAQGSSLDLWMVQRPQFDNALVRQAAAVGVTVHDGLVVRSLQVDDHGVTVQASELGTSRETTWKGRSRHVIGADGANGIVAKAVNLRSRRRLAFALETELPHDWNDSRHPYLRPDIAHLDYGAVSRGYGWIFPKGDSLNIGAGVFYPSRAQQGNLRRLRQDLEQVIQEYCSQFHLNPQGHRLYAHPLPLWQGREPRQTPKGHVLLVGDAAGLVNPFFGDGILHGIKSGVIAAEAIASGQAHHYSRHLHQEVALNFNGARLLAGFFYRFPHWCFTRIIHRPQATEVAARLLAGDLTYAQVSGPLAAYIGRMIIRGA